MEINWTEKDNADVAFWTTAYLARLAEVGANAIEEAAWGAYGQNALTATGYANARLYTR